MTTLLLHPVGLDRTTWNGLQLDDALAVDLPGHGDAPLEDAQSLDDVADMVLDAVPVGVGPLDVVGLSLGGMVALHAALRHPRRVRSLVVACAPAATLTEVMVQRAAETEALRMRGTMSSTLKRWFTPATVEARPELIADTERRLLAADPAVVAHYWRLIAAHDVRARLGEISMPTTVVAGRGDVSVPPSAARELAAGIADARYVELPGAHMLHLEMPESFADVVRVHRARAARRRHRPGNQPMTAPTR